MIIVMFSSLLYLLFEKEEVSEERDRLSMEHATYLAKRDECSGLAQTNNSILNNAGLSSCGGELATAHLTFKSLQDINTIYCGRQGVVGCAIPLTRSVYVCIPGTTYSETIWPYIYTSTCDDYYKTIRHELLHLVYFDLTPAERLSVAKKLSPYKSAYIGELSGYSSTEHDSELFVRVGADGRPVDDIELIDLYSKVTATYLGQKEKYYGSLADTTSDYVIKYERLSKKYSSVIAIFVILIIMDIVFLVYCVISSRNNVGQKHLKSWSSSEKTHSQTSKREVYRRPSSYYDSEDAELESLRKSIDEMGQKAERSSKKEFEEFKKKYGIIDIEDF